MNPVFCWIEEVEGDQVLGKGTWPEREARGNFLEPLAAWSSRGLLRGQQRPSDGDREHLPRLISPVRGDSSQKTVACSPGERESECPSLPSKEKKDLFRDQFARQLMGWVRRSACRMPQPVVDSVTLAFNVRASFCLSGADAMDIGTVFVALLRILTFLHTL